ncbi:MAG: LuxR C-terminal-related transcriptional regulator [Acidimicrobiia bacterium]
MRASDTVGIDDQMDESFQCALGAVLRGLRHPVEAFSDPTQWLRQRTGNLAVVAIPGRSSGDVRAAVAAIPGSVVVGASSFTPGPETFREYLKAGVNGLIAADQTSSELTNTLAATLTGLVVIPANVADALVDRLEEPPPHLELTARDREILRLVTQGAELTQIAAATGCSGRHLRRITGNLLASIGATNRAHAAALTTRWGLD